MPQPNARDTGLPVIHYIRKTVGLNELTNAGAGGVLLGTIPAAAFITQLLARIEQAFNASGTNVLTVGTNASRDDLAGSGDITEGSLQTQVVTTGAGLSLTGDTDVFIKYVQTGTTAANAGVASILLAYAPK